MSTTDDFTLSKLMIAWSDKISTIVKQIVETGLDPEHPGMIYLAAVLPDGRRLDGWIAHAALLDLKTIAERRSITPDKLKRASPASRRSHASLVAAYIATKSNLELWASTPVGRA
jgi:hypothetical protein